LSDPDFAQRVLASVTFDREDCVYIYGLRYPRSYFVGRIAHLRNDEPAAQAAFTLARDAAAASLQRQPDSLRSQMVLAIIDSSLGRHDEAVREAKAACDRLPMEKDAVAGADLQIELACIEARAGKIDDAIGRLEMLARVPSPLDFGFLTLFQDWDSLRGDSRFQAIVEQFAPKSGSL
jgi:hypothetical protein